ncbi:MAG: phosphatase PAP2 family protein [candidate division KSB1 bacterium]|nr:phosphatase PAP2 family protein [candidate division KSB1 bacterium]MDZ7301278.1 phosphatase PAP2 family protein [candidate division KSB1 bacterium]MDZ7310837.1 phosphatase PAP2 family protein [candidate division KSB1 bacterium]
MFQVIAQNLGEWDTLVFSKIFSWNGKWLLDRLMHWISRSGDGYLYGVIAIVLFFLDYDMARQLVPVGLIGFAIEIPIYLLVKHKIKRGRPFTKIPGIRYLIKPPDEFSFPSGHTAAAFLMATLLSTFYPTLTLPCYFWAIIIGFSRVYNGVHYPTDVLAGVLLGITSAEISVKILL